MTDSPSEVEMETPERHPVIGAAHADARDWTVCAMSRDPGVIRRSLILGHMGWRMEHKEIPGSSQRDLQC